MRILIRLVVIGILISAIPASATETPNFPSVVMRSTYKIEGRGSTGTFFILSKMLPNNREIDIMVTAGHVLKGMKGDDAVIYLRKNNNGIFEKIPFLIKIRNAGKQLWTDHPSSDIAAMIIALPDNTNGYTIDVHLLADDAYLNRLDINPGDDIFCLGYPLAQESNDAGFPILRNGKIASYPILPTTTTKQILIDFKVFPGNSGGPAIFYYPSRWAHNTPEVNKAFYGILGLVTELSYVRLHNRRIPFYENTTTIPLDIGVILPASLIKETIDLLPIN